MYESRIGQNSKSRKTDKDCRISYKQIDPVSKLGEVFDVESLTSFVMPTKMILQYPLLLLLLTIT